MFLFGGANQIGQVYLDQACTVKSHKKVEITLGDEFVDSFDSMDDELRRCCFTYVYLAYQTALEDGVDSESLSDLVDFYDKLFVKIAASSPRFCNMVDSGMHQFLPGFDIDTINKYRFFAGLAPVG